MDLPERIRHAREKAGLNQSALGEAIGVESHAAVSRYESGKREPTVAQLIKIAQVCRVDPAWLMLGQGDDERLPSPAPTIPAPWTPGPEYAAVPRYDAALSAGAGSIADPHAEPLGHQLFELQWLRALTKAAAEDLAVVRVAGDSMEPTLHDGDWVLVDRSQIKVNREGVYALAVGDTAWVKRITLNLRDRLIRIISDNPAYPMQELSEDELMVIGRVVWIVGRKI
ncbi:XRE family transcriptional regulator [Novispirillum sp. DQ9]|uniref:XRE family transcriptional regulator n=1 Tax=Novispirillum sp. DQ9 TaxID=3398612 RepID=UPI003C7CB39B